MKKKIALCSLLVLIAVINMIKPPASSTCIASYSVEWGAIGGMCMTYCEMCLYYA